LWNESVRKYRGLFSFSATGEKWNGDRTHPTQAGIYTRQACRIGEQVNKKPGGGEKRERKQKKTTTSKSRE
jgi:hypothetical protein